MTAETLSQRILTSKQKNQKKEEDREGLGNQDQITNDLFPDCTLRSTAQNNTKHHNDPKIETLKIFFIGVPSSLLALLWKTQQYRWASTTLLI